MLASHCCCLPVKVLTSLWGGTERAPRVAFAFEERQGHVGMPRFWLWGPGRPHPMSLHASTDTMAQLPPGSALPKGPKAANGGQGVRKRPGGAKRLQKLSRTRDKVTAPAALVLASGHSLAPSSHPSLSAGRCRRLLALFPCSPPLLSQLFSRHIPSAPAHGDLGFCATMLAASLLSSRSLWVVSERVK